MASDIRTLGLIPIRNFGIIHDGLYRSAQPMYGYEYEWLKNMLGLKYIISLREESRHDSNVASEHGLRVFNIDVVDHFPPTLAQVNHFKQILSAGVPTLFHCEHGHGRTSTFSVISKMLNGMSLDDALNHEKEVFHYQFKHKVQEEFLRGLQMKEAA
jgi:protein tyrosine/serine phosphatase